MMRFTGADLDFKKDYPDFPEFETYKINLSLMERRFIRCLQETRTDSGVPLIPSPDPEGWARPGGNPDSYHFVDLEKGILSRAGDVFPVRGRVLEFYQKALMTSMWGGVGLYADTLGPDGKPWPMVHLDLRGYRIFKKVWVRFSDPMKGIDKKYIYLGQPGFNDVIKEVVRLDRESMG